MKDKEALDKVIKLIKENTELAGEVKFELTRTLQKSKTAVESYDLGARIKVLSEMTETLKDPEVFTDQGYLAPVYIEVLEEVLKELSYQKRRVDQLEDHYFPAFDDYRPISFRRLISSLGDIVSEEDGTIVIHSDDPGLLDKEIHVYEDDGMGYSPNGASPVFSGYLNKESNSIDVWI